MFLFSPARLRALTWLGAFVVLVLMTEGTCTWGQYSDVYSRTPLPEELVCELARIAATASPTAECVVVERTETALQARVRGADDEWVETCFLKAGRWFVVDHGPRITCPASPPAPMERVTSWSQEWKVESRWQDLISTQRQQRERDEFRRGMMEVLVQSRALEPSPCPASLPSTKVPALDSALLAGSSRAWHFVTDDDLEKLFGPPPTHSWDPRPSPPAVIALVDFDDRALPVGQHPGSAHGALVVVDWPRRSVLCKAPLIIEQPDNAFRDLSRSDMLMPDFKDRVANGVANQLTRMSGASLELRPTW